MDNMVKTVVLLGLLTGLLLGVGQLVGGFQGLSVAFVFVILMNIVSYFFSDRIVLAMYRAAEAKGQNYAWLSQLVADVASRANIPKPKVYIIPSDSPNAFACGRDPGHSAVAFTNGILHLLSKQELKGVVAHELSHVKNRDTLIQAVAATIAGIISYVAMMARYAAFFGGGRDRDNNNVFGLLALTIITPLIAMLLQLALSRSREYLADETGARTIKDSGSLASALEKLEKGSKTNPMRFGSPATSSLFIVNPFSASGIINMLSTHPPLSQRVQKLRAMRF